MSLKDLKKKSEAAMEQSAVPAATPASGSDSPKRPTTSPGATAMMQPTIDALNDRAKAAERQVILLEEKVKDLKRVAIPVSAIEPNPWQPRKVFDEGDIQRLADSINEIGLIQPVVVRSVGNPNTFQIVSGERRLRAHRLLSLNEIKAVVIEVSDQEMAMMAMAENIAREDLTAFEISKAIRAVQGQFKTIKRLAEAIGVNRTELYKYLAFGDLPGFILNDLELSPGILGRDAAMDIMAQIKKHGQIAIDSIERLWPRVKSGEVDQGKIAATIEALVTRGQTVRTDRDIKKLFIGKEQAGSITRDAAEMTIKIRAAALSTAKEGRLREFVQKLLLEAD
jgi:ParB family chromosome partitioning protein